MGRNPKLRAEAMDRSGGTCEWTLCIDPAVDMAHIRGLGRGGNPDGSRDTIENVWMLCRFHHDMLDGRRRIRLWEVESLVREIIELRALSTPPPGRLAGFPTIDDIHETVIHRLLGGPK